MFNVAGKHIVNCKLVVPQKFVEVGRKVEFTHLIVKELGIVYMGPYFTTIKQ